MSDLKKEPKISEKKLARIQAWSGIIFATFLALHLANTLLANAGQETYNQFMRLVRNYYQFPLIEIAVIGGALVHMWAGFVRFLRRRRRASQNENTAQGTLTLRMRLHRWSGYYLSTAFAGHVIATRGPGLFADHPADFSFLTLSLTYWPAFFYPYYILLFASGAFHLVNGTLLAAKLLGAHLPQWATLPKAPAFWAAAALLTLGGTAAILALGGVFFEVDTTRFAEFQNFYKQIVPFMKFPWEG